MKTLLITILTFTIFCSAKAQSIWSNTITGSNPGLVNPFTSDQVVNGNWTVSGMGHSLNVSGTSGNDIYNTNLWSTSGVLDESRYLYFTLTPNAGHKINLESFTYISQAASNGPVSFSLRSSIDGYSSDIGQPNATGTTINLSSFQNITVPITLRLYAYGASDPFGTFGIEQFEFRGNTPLPVQFGKIEAVLNKNILSVEWETETETDNSLFTIQVSKDGNQFMPVRKVNSKAPHGTSHSKLSYHEQLEINKHSFSMMVAPFIIMLFGVFSLKARIFQGISFALLIAIFVLLACSKSNPQVAESETKLFVRITQTDIDGKMTYSKIVKAIQ